MSVIIDWCQQSMSDGLLETWVYWQMTVAIKFKTLDLVLGTHPIQVSCEIEVCY